MRLADANEPENQQGKRSQPIRLRFNGHVRQRAELAVPVARAAGVTVGDLRSHKDHQDQAQQANNDSDNSATRLHLRRNRVLGEWRLLVIENTIVLSPERLAAGSLHG